MCWHGDECSLGYLLAKIMARRAAHEPGRTVIQDVRIVLAPGAFDPEKFKRSRPQMDRLIASIKEEL